MMDHSCSVEDRASLGRGRKPGLLRHLSHVELTCTVIRFTVILRLVNYPDAAVVYCLKPFPFFFDLKSKPVVTRYARASGVKERLLASKSWGVGDDDSCVATTNLEKSHA